MLTNPCVVAALVAIPCVLHHPATQPTTPPAAAQPAPEPAGDAFLKSVNNRIEALAKASGGVASITRLATSTHGKPIEMIRLGNPPADADPAAVLIVAGADGRHRTGVEVALGLCETIARTSPPWVKARTVYVVPCLNPDAFAKDGPVADSGRLPMDDDADHDRRIAEDPAEDLDHDGLVLTMRVKNPAPSTGLQATHIEDPDEPRLLRPIDAAKGERAMYAVLTEGIDNDNDGKFNEDGWGGSAGGGIDLDMNWPAHWPQFKDGSGSRPLQTPETAELAKWCLAHPEIAAVVAFGRHDTLVNIPEAGKMDPSGEVPLGIENDDKPFYEAVSSTFKEITGINECPKPDTGGSFVAWAYTNLGVPALATPVWVRPDLVKEEKRFKPPAAEPPAKTDAPAADTPKDKPEPPKADQPKAEKKEEKKDDKKEGKPKKKESGGDDQKWLKYFDDRGADLPAGFAAWKPFKHPQLGDVEIGGFVPRARMNAPAAEVPHLVELQAAFLSDLLGKLPTVETTMFVSKISGGMWRVTLRVTNTGTMPTRTAMGAKARRLPPMRAKISVDPVSIIAGGKAPTAERLSPGATFEPTWTIRAADDSEVTVTLTDPLLTTRTIKVKLTPTATPTNAPAAPEAAR